MTIIAKPEGISRTIASRNANSPECRQMFAEFVSAEQDEMRAMFYSCIRAVEHALNARREYMTMDGQITYGGPDNYAAWQQRSTYAISWLQAGSGKATREAQMFAEVVNKVADWRVFAGAHQSSALHWVGLGQLSRRCHQGMRGSQCRNKTFPTARTISITDTSRSMLPRQRQNEPADATLSWSGPG